MKFDKLTAYIYKKKNRGLHTGKCIASNPAVQFMMVISETKGNLIGVICFLAGNFWKRQNF